VVFLRRRPEQFREDGFQRICPHLVSLYGRMKVIRVHHAFEELARAICQLGVDVEITDLFAVGESG